MASSSILQKHLLISLCLQLFIIVPLISKGIVAPYSQLIDFKVADSLQFFWSFIFPHNSDSFTYAMDSSLLQCLSDIIPVENNQTQQDAVV